MNREELHARLRQYTLPLLTPQKIGDLNGVVELEGSASILEIGDQLFLVTASHVLQRTDSTHLLYPVDGDGAAAAVGERLRFTPGQNEYDIGVLRIDGPAPRAGISRLTVNDLYLEDTPEEVLVVGCGYPYSKNKVRYRSKSFRNKCYSVEWPTLIHDDYAKADLNPNHHIALDFDVKSRPNKENLPKLIGMSGGPIWIRAAGREQVIGVIQYHEASTVMSQQAVYGTKITLALSAIGRAFPDLAPYVPVEPMPEDLVVKERSR